MRKTVILFSLLFSVTLCWAQEGNCRRWAVDGQIGLGLLRPLENRESAEGSLPKDKPSIVTKLHLEYYLPHSPFSLKAGFEHEEMKFMNKKISCGVSQLMAGGRYYPAPSCWRVQPFLGADLFFNVNSRHEDELSGEYGVDGTMCEREGHIALPRFSAGPVAGADIYLLPTVALQVEYGYRWGLDSHVDIYSRYHFAGEQVHSYGHVHRHVLSLGAKVVF